MLIYIEMKIYSNVHNFYEDIMSFYTEISIQSLDVIDFSELKRVLIQEFRCIYLLWDEIPYCFEYV